MENYGVPPDVYVDNTPTDFLKGRDAQIEKAVEVLKQELAAGVKRWSFDLGFRFTLFVKRNPRLSKGTLKDEHVAVGVPSHDQGSSGGRLQQPTRR